MPEKHDESANGWTPLSGWPEVGQHLGEQTSVGVHQRLAVLFRSASLPPAQRRIAQHVLETLPDAAFLSSSELAKRAGVSQPSVTRLAASLGFTGHTEFRNALRRSVLHSPGRATPLATTDAIAIAVNGEQANLATLRHELGNEVLNSASLQMSTSHPLGILGIRASAALAQYTGYFARRVHPDVRVMSDGAALEDDLLQLHSAGGSTVLAFVMPRYPLATLRALDYADQLGLHTIVVVDNPLAPFADKADVILTAPVGSGLVFDSHAAAVVLAMSLIHAMAAHTPERTQALLREHEDLVPAWAAPAIE